MSALTVPISLLLSSFLHSSFCDKPLPFRNPIQTLFELRCFALCSQSSVVWGFMVLILPVREDGNPGRLQELYRKAYSIKRPFSQVLESFYYY